MSTILLRKIWVRINKVLTGINLAIVALVGFPVFAGKRRPVRIPLGANIGLLALLILILTLLINKSAGL